MHPAVELLMKRMESNPDEFVKGHDRFYKWERIIENYRPFFPEEDAVILKTKYSALQLDRMHKEIMAELLYGDETPSMVEALDKENARREYMQVELQKMKLEQDKLAALKKYHKLKATQP
jgi:hypothetical protein